jgi:hypothetical protein
MEKNPTQFPTEDVKLPSKGLLYPKDSPLSKGVIEMKYMTAKEEDILTNSNYIEDGTVLDKLLESLIITPIDYNILLNGDKNALLLAARILGYGSDYEFNFRGEKIHINLSKIKDKEMDKSLIVEEGLNEFDFTLPTTKETLTFKLLTHGDENAIEKEIKGLKKLNKNVSTSGSTRLKHVIIAINGDRDKKNIRDFVDNRFLAKDAREFRKYIEKVQPTVDLTFDHEDRRGNIEKINIPVGIKFFWPDATI